MVSCVAGCGVRWTRFDSIKTQKECNEGMMSKTRKVRLYKSGNMFFLDPTTDEIFELLRPLLTFETKMRHHGWQAAQRKRSGLSVEERKQHAMFELDQYQRFVAMFGYWKLVRDALRAAGYQVICKDTRPIDPKKLKPYWENLDDIQFRDNQKEMLDILLKHPCGRIDCAPGFGKTFSIGCFARLLPRARIDIVSKRASVIRDRIYPELVGMVGDVGIVGAGKRLTGKRVMCYTVDSAHHATGDADFLFGDECHELASDDAASQLVKWQNSRNFGLSASNDMRWDGKDFRLHGLFGPIIFAVNYQAAQQANMVVPLKVLWSSVSMDYNPCRNLSDVDKKRQGFWTNDFRNQQIAADAKKYDDDTQVLIVVETLEHAMNLKRLLPDFTLVYRENGLTPIRLREFVAAGLCKSSEPMMDIDRRMQLTQAFEKGKLKKVIATTVWNVGVSFNNLSVLIRADGGSSSIADVQIPGRVSRISDGKPFGVIHDYLDQFDSGYKQRATKRSRNYKSNGWEQVFPPSTAMNTFLE